jgi:hypothetical protein
MISINSNQEEIYFFLERTENLPPHFDKEYVCLAEDADDLLLVLYSSSENRFTMIRCAHYLERQSWLVEILIALDSLLHEGTEDSLVREAQSQAEQHYNVLASNRFFDAH